MKTHLFTQKVMTMATIVFMMVMTLSVNEVSGQPFTAQIVGVNQVVNGTLTNPGIQGMNVTFLYFNPPGGTPQFFNIYAQVPGHNNIAWVAMNIYLDIFPSQRVLNRSISLNQLGIPDNVPVPIVNFYIEHSNAASIIPSTPVNFISYNCLLDTVFMYDTFTGDSAGTGGVLYTPADYGGPVQASILRGCNVPNVDLDNKNHPAKGTYAGDLNACAPASVANSLGWIEAANANVGSDGLTERQRLEELSALMRRLANGGATPEQIVQAKISFIANHGLKLKVEYHHASGSYDEDKAWLQQQYDAGQDIELDYSYVQNGETKSHAVVLTDLKITGSVPQIAFKDDKDQKKAGGTGETTTEFSEGADGHITFVRNGIVCTINNIYAESYDPEAGTFTNPKTGTTTTTFCKTVKKKCEGACPALISFYGPNQQPIVTYPECDPRDCCDINIVYTDANGACQPKKKDCKGACDPIYRSKKDAKLGKNPIPGKCEKQADCQCKYNVTDKLKSGGDSQGDGAQAEVSQQGKLKIFPNPAVQEINISVSDFEGKYQLQLINILGKQVIARTIELNGEEIFTLDVSSLAPGIYMVVLSDDDSVSKGTFVK